MKGQLNDTPLFPGFEYRGQLVDRFGNVLAECPFEHNLIPKEGVKYLADLLQGVGTVVAPWYAGVFAGNFAPTSATKAADLPGTVGEATNYSQATRRQWNATYDDNGVLSNASDRVEFTFTGDTTIYGGFLVSDSTKGSTSGLLLSIARFATPFSIPSGSTFKMTVQQVLAA